MNYPFFTADLHLNHFPIIQYTNRPFKSLDEMNEELIKRWNAVVPQGGLVYVIGDLIWGTGRGYSTHGTVDILHRLNGNIFLIEGSQKGFQKIVATSPLKKIRIDGQDVVLCHYCMKTWQRSHFDSWHLFGHSHNRLKPEGKSLDVGVDGHNYYPWTWFEIKEYMNKRPHNFNYIETYSGRSL